MTSIIETFEPAALCLLASLVWAPIVLAGALRLDRGRSVAASETLWICALCIAVLPTLMAPALEAAGVSLRPERVVEFSAPSDAAPLIAAREAKTPSAASTHVVAPAAAPSLSADLVFGAAALIYTYGALLALGAYLVRGALFARQVRCARPVDHPELLRALGDFSRRLGVKRRFELRRSEAVSTVCVFGLFRPVILMPRDIDARLSLQDLALMGAHELAHVKRGDAALYTFCALLRVVFWFNPFVRQIAARAELAAEQGADALVLSLGADRRRYAACFIEGLKFAAERAQIARFATPSFTPFDRQSRRDRLNAILEGGQRRARPLRLVVAVALAVAGGGAFAQAGLAVAPQTRIVSAEPVRIDTREGKPMRAPFDGVVVAATDAYRGKPSYGKVVVLKHDDGRSTLFARLASYNVRKGDKVSRGDQIGVAGRDPMVVIDAAESDLAASPAVARALSGPATVPAAPPAPVAPAARSAPETAPAPKAAPTPEADRGGISAEADIDAALEGAEPPSAPDAPDPPGYSFVSPQGAAYFFEMDNGVARLAFVKPDGAIVGTDGHELSEDEKQRLEKKFTELKNNLRETREKGNAWVWFDGATLQQLRKLAALDAKEFAQALKRQGLTAREMERIRKQALRDAEHAIWTSRQALKGGWSIFTPSDECDAACMDEARQEAEAERDRELAEAEAERADALAEAEAEREAALEEANAAREVAIAEAEAARQEAEEERQRIEEEIQERAQALRDAERDLAEERAELERLKAELAAIRKQSERS